MEVAALVTVVMLPELSFMWAAMAMAGRTEEGALEVPTVETVQTEPLPMPTFVSAMGRAEAGAFEASVENVAVGQVSVPMPPTLAATGWTVLEEVLLQEGSASPGDGTGPS
jgi:hypothetical protein